MLINYGWETVRHKHSDYWPVTHQTALEDVGNDLNLSMSSLAVSVEQSNLSLSTQGSPKLHLAFPEEHVPKSRCNTHDSGVSSLKLAGDAPLVQPESYTILSEAESTGSDSRSSVMCEDSRSMEAEKDTDENNCVFMSAASDEADISEQKRDQISENVSLGEIGESSDYTQSSTPTVIVPEFQTPVTIHQEEDESKETEDINTKDVMENKFSNLSYVTSERTSSHDSGRTSKSQTESTTTDSMTSGFSSYDSNNVNNSTVLKMREFDTDLNVITADDSSNTTLSSNATSTLSSDASTIIRTPSHDHIHPSDTLRRAVNLKRIPSLRRRYSNPSMGHFNSGRRQAFNSNIPTNTDGCRLSNGAMSLYITPRNSQGYESLRELQRQRTQSIEVDNQHQKHHTLQRFTNIYEEIHGISKTTSMDFRRPSKR